MQVNLHIILRNQSGKVCQKLMFAPPPSVNFPVKYIKNLRYHSCSQQFIPQAFIPNLSCRIDKRTQSLGPHSSPHRICVTWQCAYVLFCAPGSFVYSTKWKGDIQIKIKCHLPPYRQYSISFCPFFIYLFYFLRAHLYSEGAETSFCAS